MPGKTDTKSTPADTSRFATTHWSLVLAAGSPESTRYQEALEILCQTYWYPLYAFLRKRGHDVHKTEDHIQSFLAYIIEKCALGRADRNRGKFRSFLVASLRNFLNNEWDHAHSKKRGGHKRILSLDTMTAEARYALEPVDRLSPDKLFERSWALTILDKAMTRLQSELTDKNKGDLFNHLKTYMTADRDTVPYQATAQTLGMTETAVKVAVHRLRKRYRELLRDEIAQTVSEEMHIDEEIGNLFSALAR
jgi:RNA polymerase sigma factor (sigma-70 family)